MLKRITICLALGASLLLIAQKTTTSGPIKVTGKGTTLPDGLQYWDIQVGSGATAIKGQKVSMHYTGWLTNGKQFDTSGSRTFPFTLGAGEVIKGWDEGVAGMKVGGKRQLKIPPQLAYGSQGVGGGLIPPNSTLIFDVELVSIP